MPGQTDQPHPTSASSSTARKPRPGPTTVTVSPSAERVTLSKGSHHWTFSCEAGQERPLLLRLAELASRDDVPFDWFDAALVSHQLRNRLLPGLARIDSSST